MTRTLTTEQLRAEMIEKIAVASGLRARDGRNVVAKAIYIDVVQPLLATNREAQPVGVMNIGSETCSDYRVAWTKSGTQLGKGVHWLYTTPPAPAVPDAVDYSDLDATSQDREVIEAIAECKGWNACRAAMLQNSASGEPSIDAGLTADKRENSASVNQPVSGGYKLPDNVREALTLALQAMEFMGDTLNNIDTVCSEDVEFVTPAFTAVRGLLAAAPDVANGAAQ